MYYRWEERILTRMSEATLSAEALKQIQKRRTFAIISHPDAGKTTLTEKLLLYGGAIRQAGSVKARKAERHATSDWMEIEKQRGISVTSSAMQFEYDGYRINILDTPGHQDFSEDTYRVLVAADAAVMLIDAAKGVEEQTIKLFKVCRLRNIPIFTFVNKMDRASKDPFALMEELEQVLAFLRDTGLPLTLAQLGVKEIVPETLKKVEEAAVVPTQSTKNLRADITAQEVYDAILEADRIGRDYLAR